MTSTYSLVMRAYPTSYRAEHGEELVFTANELSDGWSFRQSRSLLVEGLRTRTRLATNGSPKEAWASGVAFALGFGFLMNVTELLLILVGFGSIDGFLIEDLPPTWLVLAFALAPIAMMISTRWPTALIVVAVITALQVYSFATVSPSRALISSSLPTAIYYISQLFGWAVMAALLIWLAARTDGPRAFSPRSGALLTAAAVGLAWLVDSPFAPGLVLPLLVFSLLVLGLALITIDPRPLMVVPVLALVWLAPAFWFFSSWTELVVITAITLFAFGGLSLVARYSVRRTLTT